MRKSIEVLTTYGPHVSALILVLFLAVYGYRDTILGRILMGVVGVAYLLIVWIGLTH